MRPVKPHVLIAGLAVVCVALPAAAAGTPAPLASASPARSSDNSVTFQDSTGENPKIDIQTVTVSNDDAGLITFQINIPDQPALTGDMLIDITADTDANPTTGDPQSLGGDYAIELFQGQVNLFRWDGTSFTRRLGDPPESSLIFSYANGVADQDQRPRARQHEALQLRRDRRGGRRRRPDDREHGLHECTGGPRA